MNSSSPVVKYGITDGEQVGWFAEADTLKKAAALIRNAKDFVIAIENSTPRELTPKRTPNLRNTEGLEVFGIPNSGGVSTICWTQWTQNGGMRGAIRKPRK